MECCEKVPSITGGWPIGNLKRIDWVPIWVNEVAHQFWRPTWEQPVEEAKKAQYKVNRFK
jgi:hypothetical protein